MPIQLEEEYAGLKAELEAGRPESAAVRLRAVLASWWRRKRRAADLLVRAADEGDAEVIAFLVGQGCEPDGVGSLKATALEMACYRGHLEAVRVLVARGASLTPPRFSRRTSALQRAAFYGHDAVVGFLLEHGADPQEVCGGGEASLFRIKGSVLRRLAAAGGVLPPGIVGMLEKHAALGDHPR